MSRMMKMFRTLREENESIVQLKGICPDGKVPKGLLLEGKQALESELTDRKEFFTKAKKPIVGGLKFQQVEEMKLLKILNWSLVLIPIIKLPVPKENYRIFGGVFIKNILFNFKHRSF